MEVGLVPALLPSGGGGGRGGQLWRTEGNPKPRTCAGHRGALVFHVGWAFDAGIMGRAAADSVDGSYSRQVHMADWAGPGEVNGEEKSL